MPVCQVHRPLNRRGAQRLRSCCLHEDHPHQSNRHQDHNNRARSHLPACAAQQLVLRELHSYLILLLWEHPIRVIQHSRQVQRAVAPAPQHSNVALARSPALHQLFLLLATLDALEFVPVVSTGPEWSASPCAQVSQFRSASANRLGAHPSELILATWWDTKRPRCFPAILPRRKKGKSRRLSPRSVSLLYECPKLTEFLPNPLQPRCLTFPFYFHPFTKKSPFRLFDTNPNRNNRFPKHRQN